MTTMVRLRRSYDAAALVHELQACERLHLEWATQTYYGKSAHDNWVGLSLRSRGGVIADASGGTGSLDLYADTPLLQHAPYIRQLLSELRCHLLSVRLSALRPGGRINPHRDNLPDYWLRLHIPITTTDEVIFKINDEVCTWRPGELWYGDFRLVHQVENPSHIARVHLVVDAVMNPALAALFPQGFDTSAFQSDTFNPAQASDALCFKFVLGPVAPSTLTALERFSKIGNRGLGELLRSQFSTTIRDHAFVLLSNEQVVSRLAVTQAGRLLALDLVWHIDLHDRPQGQGPPSGSCGTLYCRIPIPERRGMDWVPIPMHRIP